MSAQAREEGKEQSHSLTSVNAQIEEAKENPQTSPKENAKYSIEIPFRQNQ